MVKQVIVITLTFVLLCFCCIYIFTLPSFISAFNLTLLEKSNIATTINGITAPLLGIFTIALLFITLKMQIQANSFQNTQATFNLLNLQINKLEDELQNFSLQTGTQPIDPTKQPTSETVQGYLAFQRFVGMINTSNLHLFANEKDTLKYFEQTLQIVFIIRFYDVIKERIDLLKEPALQSILRMQIQMLYEFKLKRPLSILMDAIEKRPQLRDEFTNEIGRFLSQNNV